jgi:hypothetical protein
MFPDLKGLIPALLIIGAVMGLATSAVLWLLWHFVLSHIALGWH